MGHLFPPTSPGSEESGTASPSSVSNSFMVLVYPQVFFTFPQLFLQILQKKSWEQEFKASSEPQLLPLQP